MNDNKQDPIFCVTADDKEFLKLGYHLGWYFFDETCREHGPFETEAEARELFEKYCKEELG